MSAEPLLMQGAANGCSPPFAAVRGVCSV